MTCKTILSIDELKYVNNTLILLNERLQLAMETIILKRINTTIRKVGKHLRGRKY